MRFAPIFYYNFYLWFYLCEHFLFVQYASDEEKENFRGTLQQLLENLNPPIECADCDSLKCVEHDVTVDTYATGICEALDQAVSTCLPLVGQPL